MNELKSFIDWLYEDAMVDLDWLDEIAKKARNDLGIVGLLDYKRQALVTFLREYKKLLGE